jgi:hypothetical protein
MIAGHAALLQPSGKPVKMIYDRAEDVGRGHQAPSITHKACGHVTKTESRQPIDF